MVTLKNIRITGYRSIKEATVDLRDINVLIGANGAGKSNFISFLKMLTEIAEGRFQEYVGTSGRSKSLLRFGPQVTPQVEGALEFESGSSVYRYAIRLKHAADDTLIFSEETISYSPNRDAKPQIMSLGAGHQESSLGQASKKGKPRAKDLWQLLKDCCVYHFHDTSPNARIRQSCYIHDNRRLLPDAGNLAAMLYAYRQKNDVAYRRIVSTIQKIMPEFDDFDLAPSRLNPNDILLNWRKRGSEYLFGPHQISDGSLRAMALASLLLQPKFDVPKLIVVDEPELGLHPHALEIVAGLMRAASISSQVIVATQSQGLLGYFDPSEVIAVDSVDRQSRFQRLDAAEFDDWLEDYSLGELWERNVLGGGPLP